jgi:DNA-binding transcriptional LysR family regulator
VDSQVDSLRAIVAVADAGSFTAAGQRLGVTPSAVSKLVSRLEQHLGLRLFQRTTRRVHATEHGASYLERTRRVLSELDGLGREVERVSDEPRGTLKITAPPMFGEQRVVPAAFRLLKRWPNLRVTFDLTDRVVDVVTEGIDVAVRYAPSPRPTSWTAHKIGEEHVVLCATPGYFAKRGIPRTPAELARHDNVVDVTGGRRYTSLSLRERPGSKRLVAIQREGRVEVDGTRSALAAALAGLGIAELEMYLVEEHLRTGRLQEVMAGCVPVRGNIYVMHAPGPNVPPKVRAFVAEMRAA